MFGFSRCTPIKWEWLGERDEIEIVQDSNYDSILTHRNFTLYRIKSTLSKDEIKLPSKEQSYSSSWE